MFSKKRLVMPSGRHKSEALGDYARVEFHHNLSTESKFAQSKLKIHETDTKL